MTNEVAVLQNLSPLAVYQDPASADAIIEKIRAEAAQAGNDISTEAGREKIRSMAYKIARSKTALDELGENLTESWRVQTKAVNEERKRVKQKMQELQDEVRKPLTDWENAEESRTDAHEEAITYIVEARDMNDPAILPADIQAVLETIKQHYNSREWEEFGVRATMEVKATVDFLEAAIQRRTKEINDAAELVRLRAAEEERQRKEREDQIAQEAADKAKREAEEQAQAEAKRVADEAAERERIEREGREKAERETKEANERAEKAAADLKASEERAEADRVQAEADAKRREEEAAQKVRDEQAAEDKRKKDDEAKREKDLAHKKKINNDVLADIMQHCKLNEAQGKEVITALAKGLIRHTKISY